MSRKNRNLPEIQQPLVRSDKRQTQNQSGRHENAVYGIAMRKAQLANFKRHFVRERRLLQAAM